MSPPPLEYRPGSQVIKSVLAQVPLTVPEPTGCHFPQLQQGIDIVSLWQNLPIGSFA